MPQVARSCLWADAARLRSVRPGLRAERGSNTGAASACGDRSRATIGRPGAAQFRYSQPWSCCRCCGCTGRRGSGRPPSPGSCSSSSPGRAYARATPTSTKLGICYAPATPQHWAPEPADDPGRHRRKARTLDAVVANFRDAGARCVVVPGVTDPVRGVATDVVPHAALTPCRLRAEPAELGRRLAARGGPTDDLAAELVDADALDRAFATGACVDTTGLSVAQVVDRVRARTGWPDLAAPVEKSSPTRRIPDSTPGESLWLCGPAAVGKSTVGWQVYQQVRRAGFTAAFADLDQIGFHRPVPVGDPGNHRLKAANLAAVWRAFRASGAGCLIAVGPLERPEDVAAYIAALPAATITLCRLHASRQVVADRVARRGRGLTPAWGLAGDELIGQPQA